MPIAAFAPGLRLFCPPPPRGWSPVAAGPTDGDDEAVVAMVAPAVVVSCRTASGSGGGGGGGGGSGSDGGGSGDEAGRTRKLSLRFASPQSILGSSLSASSNQQGRSELKFRATEKLPVL